MACKPIDYSIEHKCHGCGELKILDKASSWYKLCRPCHVIKLKELEAARHERAWTKVSTRWVSLLYNMSIATESPDFHTLTEEEWLETCAHFNGCALCGSEEITTRGYLVPFKLGGKYAAWNIIPMCTACAANGQRVENLFITYNSTLGKLPKARTGSRYVYKADCDRFMAVVKYLQTKMGDSKWLTEID